MKKLFFGLMIMIGSGVKGQDRTDDVRMVIDSGIVLLRTYALHRDRPDWDHVRERAYELAGQATRWEDLGPAISWLFEAVDDHQGWMSVKDTTLRWERAEQPYLSQALKEELAKGDRIIRKLLGSRIGYLRVAGRVDGQELRDSLYALEAEGARKFIIDLRVSAGGIIEPAIDGLSRLSGDGRPVVVLTGHGTGSAGAGVAVAFKGRKHTWFIGEPTAGYTTGNVRHWIVEGKVGIVIAETMLKDRKGRSYRRNLIPDEWVPGGDNFLDPDQDKKIQAAVKRLNER